MSLAVLIDTVLEENEQQAVQAELGEVTAHAVIVAIQETPLRVEVYEKAESKAMDGLSIADVHVVLDALVEVLEGK